MVFSGKNITILEYFLNSINSGKYETVNYVINRNVIFQEQFELGKYRLGLYHLN